MSSSPAAPASDVVTAETLHEEAARIAGRLNRAHADLVDLVARLVDGEMWGEGGFRWPEHWLTVRVGLSPSHAADVVRVARRRAELRAAARAFESGQLSLDQAAVVARYAPASHDHSVTLLARNATVV